jgi:hypothetical protein
VPPAERPSWYEATAGAVAALRAVVELTAGRDDDARVWRGQARGDAVGLRRLDAALAVRAGASSADALIAAERAMPPDSVTGWRAVAAGDADALLRQLYTRDWHGPGAWVVYGAPRVPAARRPELATWLLWNAPAPCVTCSLRRRVVDLATRDRAARAYGARSPDGAALAALREPLRRRNTAVPLAALDALEGAVLW